MPLARIAFDYRWSWDPDGAELFRSLDPLAWELNGRNPVRQLEDLPPHAVEAAAGDAATRDRIARLAQVLEDDRARPDRPVDGLDGPVVFVCAEFGIHPSLPIYSGGLGALAGDILKEASDLALPVVGVGLLYRKGYFQQRVDRSGLQHEYWTQIVPEHLPTVQVLAEDGTPLRLTFPLAGREIAFHVWRVEVGRVPLYLLDTELDENDPVDRWITARLYEGNPLTRLGQYGLLGIGGVRALRALGIEPGVLHFNEGHPALAALELAADDVAAGSLARGRACPRPRAVRLHDPHAGARGQRGVRADLSARGVRRPAPSARDRRRAVPRPLPDAARDRRVAGDDAARPPPHPPHERRQPPARRGGAGDVAPALRRPAGRRRADHPRDERRPPAELPLAADPRAPRRPPRRRVARPRRRPGDVGRRSTGFPTPSSGPRGTRRAGSSSTTSRRSRCRTACSAARTPRRCGRSPRRSPRTR